MAKQRIPVTPTLIEAPPPSSEIPVGSNDIAVLAYHLWEARGCPEGSPEVDWGQAEQILREQTNNGKAQVSEPLLTRGSGA